MSITLNWPSQSAQGLSAIEVYRDTKRIDVANPGTPLATLLSTAESYVDDTVIENVNYFYSVAAVKGGNRTFSAIRCIPYLAKWGPADTGGYLPKGDMDAALLGWVANTHLPDPTALWGLLPDISAFTKGTWGGWWKFIHMGKVMFISDNLGITASYNQLNNLGLLFGENDPAKLPSWAAASIDHKRVITFGENEYIVRMPKLSPLALSQYVTAPDQTVNSELRDTIARLYLSSTVTGSAKNTAKERFGESAGILTSLTQHLASATTAVRMGGTANQNEEIVTTPLATAVAARWVLELVP